MNKCRFILHSHQNCFILTSSSTPQQNFATPHVENHCSWPNFFRLHRPGSGSSISSKYVGITRSLATRRTLGIPKLLKCINKAQPEPCCKKKHSSGAGAMLTKTESSGAGAGANSFLQELGNPATMRKYYCSILQTACRTESLYKVWHVCEFFAWSG